MINVDQEVLAVRMTPGRDRQYGGSKLKALIYTAILVAALYSAFKVVPIYWGNYQLEQKIQEVARFGVVNRNSDEQVRENVYNIAQDLELPLKKEDIKVSASSAIVKIAVDYKVPVDLGFYKLELHFSPSSENRSIMNP